MNQNAITQGLNTKQETLVSGTNIKTVNNTSILGTGNISITSDSIINEYSTSTTLGYSANYINNLQTYSASETKIGTWVTGKPLYRQIFIGKATPSVECVLSTTFTYNLISATCGVTFNNGTSDIQFTDYVNADYNCGIYGNKTSGKLVFYYKKASDTHNLDYVIQVTYTKPTD